MDRGRVSDFSIERILSPQLGPRPPLRDFPPNWYHRGVIGNVRAPSPVQVPLQAMGCQQCREMSFGEERFPLYRPAVHQQHFYSNPGVYAHFSQNRADMQPLAAYSGYPQPSAVPPQSLQKFRVRTVFTDSQIKQLEALFEITDYPSVETRAELARRTGLSEETVRVWFKNRRARRKRQ
ncbi:dharma [Simochromis diagramma]|uniref:dharma n=1 Tax=Simochromis diagramma TaxID=43689 RepID=UPI001A7E4ED6|nr:dharma [Simochromis diagramma]